MTVLPVIDAAPPRATVATPEPTIGERDRRDFRAIVEREVDRCGRGAGTTPDRIGTSDRDAEDDEPRDHDEREPETSTVAASVVTVGAAHPGATAAANPVPADGSVGSSPDAVAACDAASVPYGGQLAADDGTATGGVAPARVASDGEDVTTAADSRPVPAEATGLGYGSGPERADAAPSIAATAGAVSPAPTTGPAAPATLSVVPSATTTAATGEIAHEPVDAAAEAAGSTGAMTGGEAPGTNGAAAADLADRVPPGGHDGHGVPSAATPAHGAHRADAPTAPRADAVPSRPGTETMEAPPTPWRQVADALREVRRDRDGSHTMTVRLDPPELGTVDVQVHVRDGRISVHASAHSVATRDLLARLLPELRIALESHGLQTGSIDVGAHPHAQSGPSSDAGAGTGGNGRHRSIGAGAGSGRAQDAPRRTTAGAAAGRLDLRL